LKIIAELCQNHGGSVDLLLKMADTAASAGATHIKVQHITAANLCYRPEFEIPKPLSVHDKYHLYRPWNLEFSRLSSLELSSKEYITFVNHVLNLGLIPLTTCFTRGDINSIRDQGFKEIKVASYDCSSYALVRELAKAFSHIYVSTGASYSAEVSHTADLLKLYSTSFSLLHCRTIYPTPLALINLCNMIALKAYTPNVGLSDHSSPLELQCLATKAAIHLGATVIERHFTTSDRSQTKDGPVSIDSVDLQDIVLFSKLSHADQALALNEICADWQSLIIGTLSDELSQEELANRSYYKGRFATPRFRGAYHYLDMIQNWDETSL